LKAGIIYEAVLKLDRLRVVFCEDANGTMQTNPEQEAPKKID